MEWEEIDRFHKRAKVFGGWIVKAYEKIYEDSPRGWQSGYNWRASMCFVPDSNHEWKIGEGK